MTFFNHQTAAARYAAARPFFHHQVIEIIRQLCSIDRCDAALDVGCGTGQSTVALTDLTEQVTGIDLSQAMLDHAMAHPRVRYLHGPAESLPFDAQSFDMLTVSLAFHWLDRERFLSEAHRVLRPASWLVVYNDGFCGRMHENTEYEPWHRSRYLQRYPAPSRNSRPLTEAALGLHGFGGLLEERFAHTVALTPDNLVDYLLTQSNTIAAVEQGQESIENVRHWLLREVTPMFPNGCGTFDFAGVVHASRRES
ncbi:MAG: methyltransferase domain-containing protein [Phycisphaerae bacterium]